MKAKVIKTDEIVDVVKSATYHPNKIYEDLNSNRYWSEDELDFDDLYPTINWEQRRFELAKSAMQGILTNMTRGSAFSDYEDRVAIQSIQYADAVIAKLKEEGV